MDGHVKETQNKQKNKNWRVQEQSMVTCFDMEEFLNKEFVPQRQSIKVTELKFLGDVEHKVIRLQREMFAS